MKMMPELFRLTGDYKRIADGDRGTSNPKLKAKKAGKNRLPRGIGFADQNQQREMLPIRQFGTSYFPLGPKLKLRITR